MEVRLQIKKFTYFALENLPYCWYFTADNVDQPDKQVEFIMSGDEKKELSNIDQFIDPLNCMFGFIVRVPKVI